MLLCYFIDLLLFLNHCIPVSDHSNNKLQTVLFWTGALVWSRSYSCYFSISNKFLGKMEINIGFDWKIPNTVIMENSIRKSGLIVKSENA